MSGEELPQSNPGSDSGEKTKPGEMKEPHLLDLANIVEVATWLALAAGSGVVGGAAYDLLTSFKRRFGGSRLRDLESRVYEALQEVQRDPDVSDEELRSRVRKLFEEAS